MSNKAGKTGNTNVSGAVPATPEPSDSQRAVNAYSKPSAAKDRALDGLPDEEGREATRDDVDGPVTPHQDAQATKVQKGAQGAGDGRWANPPQDGRDDGSRDDKVSGSSVDGEPAPYDPALERTDLPTVGTPDQQRAADKRRLAAEGKTQADLNRLAGLKAERDTYVTRGRDSDASAVEQDISATQARISERERDAERA